MKTNSQARVGTENLIVSTFLPSRAGKNPTFLGNLVKLDCRRRDPDHVFTAELVNESTSSAHLNHGTLPCPANKVRLAGFDVQDVLVPFIFHQVPARWRSSNRLNGQHASRVRHL